MTSSAVTMAISPWVWGTLLLLLVSMISAYGDVDLDQVELIRFRTPGDDSHSHVWVTSERSELNFRVKACHGARIALSYQPYLIDESILEVEISNEEGATRIQRVHDGKTLHSVNTGQLLNCNDFVQFWLSWDEEIKLGSGEATHINYTYADLQRPIKALSFATTVLGTWEYPKDAVRTSTLQVEAEDNLPEMLISEKAGSDIVFAVKSETEAKVGLTISLDETDPTYAVVIGGNSNSETWMEKNSHTVGPPIKTPGILSKEEFRYFWVSWSDGYFSFGRGKTVGSHRVLSLGDPDLPDIVAVGIFSTASGPDASYWRVEQAQYDMLALESGRNEDYVYDHWLNVGYRSVFQFEVRACSNAQITLRYRAQIEEQADTVKITLNKTGTEVWFTIFDPDGVQDASLMFKGNTSVNCNSFAALWLSWFNGNYRLGTGRSYGMNTLVEFQDPFPGRITQSLHLSSEDTGKVDWVFDRHEAKQTIFVTPPHLATGELTEAWMTIGDQQSLTIGVQACSDAVIVLASYLHIPDSSSYKISVGASDNTKVIIEKLGSSNKTVSVAKTVLSCDSVSYFWVSWRAGLINVGSGRSVGQGTIAYFGDTNAPYDIQAAAFGANPSSHNLTYWYLGDADGEYYKFSSTQQSGRVWLATAHSTVFSFKVRSNDTIQVTLSSAFGRAVNEASYILKVEEGERKNTSLSILGKPEEAVFKYYERRILSETDFVDMWIAVSADGVRFGLGYANVDEILYLQQDSVIPISGVMLTSGDDDAEWVVSKDMASVVEYNTMPFRNYGQMWLTPGSEESIVFKVRAGAQTWMLLSSQVENVDVGVFQVGIGVSDNTVTQIKRNLYDSELLAEEATPGIVNADEMRTFWISWDNALIQVGRGSYIGENAIVSWKSDEDLTFHGLSPSTDTDQEGAWEFLQFEDNTYVITTGGNETIFYPGKAVITTRDQKLNFQVRACDHVRIRYLSEQSDDDRPTYMLELGNQDNTEIKATSPFMTEEAVIPYPGVLHCAELRSFWTRINGEGGLEFGEGTYPDTLLLEYGPAEGGEVDQIAFATPPQMQGVAYWHVRESEVQTLEVMTTKQEDYEEFHILVPWMTSYSFQVMACSDVHILLARIPGKTAVDSYEIRISYENLNRVEILKNNKVVENVTVKKDLLDCSEYRFFWVSWDGGFIAVGQGYRSDAARLLHWPDPSPHSILALHVSTGGVLGRWKFSQPQGNVYEIKTNMANNYNESWLATLPDVHHLRFQLVECGNTYFMAFSQTLLFEEVTLELSFSATDEGNVDVQLKDGIDGPIIDSTTVPNVAICTNPVYFWVSWSSGVFQFGTGRLFSSVRIRYQSADLRIMSVYLASTEPSRWEFYEDQLSGLRVKGIESDEDRLWLSSLGRTSQVFDIRALSDANIVLGARLGDPVYLIELMASGTNISRITNINTGNQVTTEKPDLLSSSTFRTLWITWELNMTAFGEGPRVGENEVLRIDEGFHLGALGFLTNSDADWMVFSERSETYKIEPSRHALETQWYFNEDNLNLHFRVKACNAARIRIVSATNDWVHDSYDVLIGGEGNTRSFILNSATQQSLVKQETPKFLSCGEFKRFWLSWENDVIEVGSGEFPDHVFLTYPLPHTLSTPALNFFRDEGGSEWEISEQQDGALWTYTHDLHYRSTWLSLQGRSQVNISVKACFEAHMLMTPIPGVFSNDKFSVEVILGAEENTAIVINSLAGEELGRSDVNGSMSCDNWRQFWMTWSDHEIHLGKGDRPNEDELLMVKRKDVFPLNALSFGSNLDAQWLHGHVAEADIPRIIQDDVYIFYTTPSMADRTFALSTDSFVFSAMPCKDANVSLRASEDDMSSMYIVTFRKNETILMKTGDDAMEETFQSDDALYCGAMLQFWMKWSLQDGYFRVGKGTRIGAEEIGRLDDRSHPYAKNFISFSTAEEDSPGRWQIYQTSVHAMAATTTTNFTYSQIWWTVRSQNWQVFQVQACSDAHILLSDSPESEDNVYEVAIGIQDNRNSVIRRSVQGGNEVVVPTAQILHCNETRTFWIRWSPELIEVGRGRSVGSEEFMRLTNTPSARSITALSVSTGWSSTGQWKTNSMSDPRFTIQTGPNEEPRATLHTAFKYVNFRVRGCKEAMLHMYPSNRDGSTGYDVTLGADDNQKIIITEVAHNITTDYIIEPNLLECNTFRSFWLSWHDNELTVGRGEYLSHILHTYTSSSTINIRYIMFSSQKTDNVVTWEVPKSEGKSMVVNTNFMEPERNWLTVPYTMYVNFKVRSCSSFARLVLQQAAGSELGIPTSGTIEVILNRTSHITVDGTSVYSYDGDVINCHYGNWFWVRWSPREVTVGHSPEVGDSVIMTWLSGSPLPSIEAVEFDTPEGNGTWEFLDIEDGIYTVVTDPDGNGEHAWLTMFRQHFNFEVEACEEAIICLSDKLGDCSERAVTVTLGAESNTKSTIASSLDNSMPMVEVNTSNILDCRESHPFWIDWDSTESSAKITVGYGPPYAGEPFLEYTVNKQYNITSVSLKTGHNNVGVWQFKDESAMSTRFFTPAEKSKESVMYHTPSADSLVFSLQACSDAVILLYDHAHDASAVYEVAIGWDGNSKSSIHRLDNDDIKAVANTSDILSCSERRWFWLEWDDGGLVTFGSGERVSVSELVTLEDPEPHSISYVSLTSNNQKAEWDIPLYPEETFIVSTPGLEQLGGREINVVLPGNQKFYQFGVRACESAKITLTAGQSASPVLELEIANTFTKLFRNETTLLTEVMTPGILDCNENRVFYMNWENNIFDFSLRSRVGRKVFTYVEPPDDQRTQHIHGVTIDALATADWSFERTSGRSFRYTYPQTDNPKYDMLWQSVFGKEYVIFNVKACEDVRVLLTDIIGIDTNEAIEVALNINGGQNNVYEIRHYRSQAFIEWKEVPDLMACGSFMPFWISWQDGLVRLGSGALVGQQPIVAAHLEYGLRVSGVSYAAKDTQDTVFQFDVDEGNVYQLSTANENYERIMIIPRDDNLRFSVSACKEVHVALASVPGDLSAPLYELVIGSQDNTGTELYSGIKETPLRSKDTPNILSCDQPLDFWVSWTENMLNFGMDSFMSEKTLITYESEDLHDINGVHLTSGSGTTAQWSYLVEDQRLVHYSFDEDDSEEDNLWITVSGYSVMVFSIQTCRNARLLLAEVTENLNFAATEVVIGEDNLRSFIKLPSGDPPDTQETPGILDCANFRTFWIRWNSSGVSVGQGADPDLKEFLSSSSAMSHFVQSIAFSKSALVESVYKLDDIFGKVFTLFTPNVNRYDRLFITLTQNAVTFRVKTCKDALIALLPENGIADRRYYEIAIGSHDNTRMEIRKITGSGVSPKHRDTPNVLSCDQYRSFWISWNYDKVKGVRTGHGLVPGLQADVEFDDGALFEITQVSFTSWTESTAWWEIFTNYGELAEFKSEDGSVGSYAISVVDTSEAKFRVQACGPISVLLAVLPDNFEVLAYEIVIGYEGNSAVIVRNGVGGPILAEEKVDSLLQCDYYRTFWITWANHSLAIGRGATIGEDEVLNMENNMTLPFTSLSTSSEPGSDVKWQFAPNSDYDFGEDPIPPFNETTVSYSTTATSAKTSASTTEAFTQSSTTGTETSHSTQSTIAQSSIAQSTIAQSTIAQSTIAQSTIAQSSSVTSSTSSQPTSPSSGRPSSSTTTPPEVEPTEGDNNPGGGGLSAGAIVGIVFGVLIAIVLIGGAGFFAVKKLKNLPDDRIPFSAFRNPVYGTDEDDDLTT